MLVGMAGDAAEALGERLGLAVSTTWANLGAARNGVPGSVGPLDGRMVTHEWGLSGRRVVEVEPHKDRNRLMSAAQAGRGFVRSIRRARRALDFRIDSSEPALAKAR